MATEREVENAEQIRNDDGCNERLDVELKNGLQKADTYRARGTDAGGNEMCCVQHKMQKPAKGHALRELRTPVGETLRAESEASCPIFIHAYRPNGPAHFYAARCV